MLNNVYRFFITIKIHRKFIILLHNLNWIIIVYKDVRSSLNVLFAMFETNEDLTVISLVSENCFCQNKTIIVRRRDLKLSEMS